MAADPVVALEELAAAARDVADVLRHFPEPGSAPSTAISRVLNRMNAALEAHKRVASEITRRLLGR
jgi:hypothetical protein